MLLRWGSMQAGSRQGTPPARCKHHPTPASPSRQPQPGSQPSPAGSPSSQASTHLSGGVLVLLVLGDQVVHVGLGLGELHLVLQAGRGQAGGVRVGRGRRGGRRGGGGRQAAGGGELELLPVHR
jgi:hypothetical protein